MEKKAASSLIMIIIWIALGIAVFIILFTGVIKGSDLFNLQASDCKGTCKQTCDSGEKLFSKTCYSAGEKKDGVCCVSLENLLSKNDSENSQVLPESNLNNQNQGTATTGTGNSQQTTGTTGSTTTPTWPAVIEVRKGEDSGTKIYAGTSYDLTNGTSYIYKIWAEGQLNLNCQIKMLDQTTSQKTTVPGMIVDYNGPCETSFSSPVSVNLNPIIQTSNNKYNLLIVVKNSTNHQVASANILFKVVPS